MARSFDKFHRVFMGCLDVFKTKEGDSLLEELFNPLIFHRKVRAAFCRPIRTCKN